MTLVTAIGIAASAFSAIASLPQLIKLIKEKKAEDISIVMLLVLISGLGLWVYYGILKEDFILIISNSISLLLNGSVLTLALIYKK